MSRQALSRLLCGCLLSVGAQAFASKVPLSGLFEGDNHCVAYRVKKTMFLLKSDYVVGKNCEISVQVLPEVGGLYRVEVTIPIDGFSSGDAARDKDVSNILQAQVKAELTYRTQAFSTEMWQALLVKPTFEIPGELTIGEKSHPLTLVSSFQPGATTLVQGAAQVQFVDFALKPPTVGLGLVAKADAELELHFHLLGGRILGADSIRPQMETK